MTSVTSYIEKNEQRLLDELLELIRIPSISTLPLFAAILPRTRLDSSLVHALKQIHGSIRLRVSAPKARSLARFRLKYQFERIGDFIE